MTRRWRILSIAMLVAVLVALLGLWWTPSEPAVPLSVTFAGYTRIRWAPATLPGLPRNFSFSEYWAVLKMTNHDAKPVLFAGVHPERKDSRIPFGSISRVISTNVLIGPGEAITVEVTGPEPFTPWRARVAYSRRDWWSRIRDWAANSTNAPLPAAVRRALRSVPYSTAQSDWITQPPPTASQQDESLPILLQPIPRRSPQRPSPSLFDGGVYR